MSWPPIKPWAGIRDPNERCKNYESSPKIKGGHK